jgi:predicted pyridoxine 5'-phosphate oxidase superfamily flavin-nucleotide-binding protein
MVAYHAGERSVQDRAGARAQADRNEPGLYDRLPEAILDFLRQQPFALLGGRDAYGRVWASLLAGESGLLDPLDPKLLRVRGRPIEGDPLAELQIGDFVGLLVLESATRRRARLNGRLLDSPPGEWRLYLEQVFSNCPKYIQARHRTPGAPSCVSADPQSAPALTDRQAAWIRTADTCYLASAHGESGADVSHRGGAPGFVRMQPEGNLLLPDYPGNGMFQTLGNLSLDPRCGLLFWDLEAQRTLQLTGRAELIWGGPQVASLPGAQRALRIQVEQVIEAGRLLPFKWGPAEPSPFNPPLS